jgi:membrane-bound lytic murein transglycosylase A
MIRRKLLTGDGTVRDKVRRYMRDHPEERQELLNVNPRYVFFKLDRSPDARFAIGSLHKPLTPRRSVAADKTVYPSGALLWMETVSPARRRFVLAQDEGGAIQGPGRIDYFVGAGEEAEEEAVSFWTEGTMTIFVPR